MWVKEQVVATVLSDVSNSYTSTICTVYSSKTMFLIYCICKMVQQGCTNPTHQVTQMTKFCTVAPNTISIITAVFNLCTRMCISSYAPSRTHQVALRFTGHTGTMEARYGTCYTQKHLMIQWLSEALPMIVKQVKFTLWLKTYITVSDNTIYNLTFYNDREVLR